MALAETRPVIFQENVIVMAHAADLAALRDGVAAWNDWRSCRGDEYLDLSEVNFAGGALSFAHGGGDDPYDAYLQNIVLRRTNLARAGLSGMFVSDADFSEAYLQGADLRHSKFLRVSFRGADLTSADLGEVQLVGVDLSGAILTGARLAGGTIDGISLEDFASGPS